MSDSFEQRFCRRFNVPAERFVEAMLQRTLSRRARWLRWFTSYESAAADRCFISSVGRLTRRTDFPSELEEYRYDRRNQSFWRHTLRFRVSTARMRVVFREVWPAPAAEAAARRAVAVAPRPGVNEPSPFP